MVGAVIVSHGSLSKSLLETALSITGNIEGVVAKSVASDSVIDEIRDSIIDAIDSVDSGDGVIIFTDMLGGTPTNISLTLMEEKTVEVIAGVNLPLFIKFTSLRKTKNFEEVIEELNHYGAGTIVIAGDILKKD